MVHLKKLQARIERVQKSIETKARKASLTKGNLIPVADNQTTHSRKHSIAHGHPLPSQGTTGYYGRAGDASG